MKFSIFHPFPSFGVPQMSWPNPPKHSRVEQLSSRSVQTSLELARRADEWGIDQISVAEHHYSAKQLSPNSVMAALMVANEVTQASVGLLGVTLPLVNPLRAAEEIGFLDAVTNGKLMVGFFRGTPNEFLTYGTNPWESREVFAEQLALLRACWREPEPFAWLGRHFEYRTVSVWPQPTQHDMPVLITANSEMTATWAGEDGYIGGFSFFPTDVVAPLAARFTSAAESVGRTVTPDDMLYRCFALVDDTDESAHELFERTRFGDMVQLNRDLGVGETTVAARVGMAMAGVPASVPVPTAGGPAKFPTTPLFIGSPDTVAEQIRAFVAATGIGRLEVTLFDDRLGVEGSTKNLRLYCQEVLPQVRDLDPIAASQAAGSTTWANVTPAQPAVA